MPDDLARRISGSGLMGTKSTKLCTRRQVGRYATSRKKINCGPIRLNNERLSRLLAQEQVKWRRGWRSLTAQSCLESNHPSYSNYQGSHSRRMKCSLSLQWYMPKRKDRKRQYVPFKSMAVYIVPRFILTHSEQRGQCQLVKKWNPLRLVVAGIRTCLCKSHKYNRSYSCGKKKINKLWQIQNAWNFWQAPACWNPSREGHKYLIHRLSRTSRRRKPFMESQEI